jgi:tetratricopeptide (TPR) repeat protein
LEHNLLLAEKLAKDGEVDRSYQIATRILSDNPHNAHALHVAGYCLEKGGKLPDSYLFFRRVTELEPKRSSGWLNLARVTQLMWQLEESEKASKRAIKTAENDYWKCRAWVNLAALYIDIGAFDKAEPAVNEALKLDPNNWMALSNLGFCQLARRDWAHGWRNYRYSLGTDFRKLVQYGDEPEWDGTPGKRVAVYGEQGLGDEISFASMIPDAAEVCEKVILDCDYRLKGLFQRSFPNVKVYGTRGKEVLNWSEEDTKIDASIAIGQLGGIYRTTEDSFSGKPYLMPCPDRSFMWKSLFSKIKKPKIGIAWTGGIRHTGSKYRKLTLEDMLPVFNAVDAKWVSLQYTDASKEISEFRDRRGVDIVQYPYATLTKDYDDTAALVANLDLVVCMQTAVAHLAGGLGKECYVLVPQKGQWRYGQSGDSIPWYSSVRVIRQRNFDRWGEPIHEAATLVKRRFSDIRPSQTANDV